MAGEPLTKLNSYTKIIALWPKGGLAEDLAIPQKHINMMIYRDSIGAGNWIQVVQAARKRGIKGVSLILLCNLQTEKKHRVRIAPNGRPIE